MNNYNNNMYDNRTDVENEVITKTKRIAKI